MVNEFLVTNYYKLRKNDIFGERCFNKSFAIMYNIHIKVNDNSKVNFLVKLLKEFDFVKIVSVSEHGKKSGEKSFLDSAGIWKDRDVDADELRRKAWRIK